MKKISVTTIIMCLLVLSNATGQSNSSYVPTPLYEQLYKTIPAINYDDPTWVHMLYQQEINLDELRMAYEDYFNNNDFTKTTHTQNYKHFMRLVNGNQYFNEETREVYIPTVEEITTAETFLTEKYESILAHQSDNARNGDWTCIGPMETYDTDGVTYKSSQTNIYTVDQSLSDPTVMYAGAEGGFLFKSLDKGLNWTHISADIAFSAIRAIKIHPTNKDIVYISEGNKLYKTTNGGNSWTTLQNIWNLSITDIEILPNNTQTVLTVGSLGLKRSTDGGTSWTDILTDKCWDLEIKTDNDNTVFVAKSNPTKKITEIWKSTDGGQTFTAKTSGWFDPIGGEALNNSGARIGVTDADGDRIYVALLGEEDDNVNDNNYIGIYRSDDGGETWTTPYDGNGDGQPDNEPGGPYSDDHWCFTHFGLASTGYDQGFYNLAIDVSDTDEDLFLVGFLNLFRSTDGGVTYKGWGGYQCHQCGIGYRHPDIQEIEINGNDVWVASDGGLDYYNANFEYQTSRMKGINGAAYWGLGQGWNEDVLTGGRYHNGNAARHSNYGFGKYLSLGGAESPTGYVNPGSSFEVQHSDINGKKIPQTLTGGVADIAKYSMFPNESYYVEDKSDLVIHPFSWETLFLGKQNKVWKSEDNGNTFEVIGTFGTNESDIVLGLEVSRTNPDVMYAAQRASGSSKLWKTTNGGSSWSQLTAPVNGYRYYISMSAEDENEIYLAIANGGNSGNKIYKSTNGGSSWTNLTTSIFNGETPKGIQVQYGTNGGVYVVTNQKVYYKNNTIAWQLFSDGLPTRLNYQNILPFYKGGKLRMALENGGIWETDLYENSSTIAQPMVKNKTVFCSRDKVYFDSYSVAQGAASYSWSFSPTPDWVSSTTVRNPEVIFGGEGSYSATLTVTTPNGSDTKTITNIVTIEADCDPEIIPGRSLECSVAGDYVNVGDIDLNTNEVTFTAWVKPNGIQPEYSGIVMNNSNVAAGFNFRENNNTLAYHWPGGAWWWDSGLEVPAGEWSHVAMVVKPTGVTLYLNGESNTHNFTAQNVDLSNVKIGSYGGWSSRNYKGEIDEVCIYDKALTQDEVRALRHLTKDPTDDASLIHYYQFNRNAGLITDRVSVLHASPVGNASRAISTAPVGGGESYSIDVSSGGEKDFTGTDLKLTFPASGTYPNGELVVSKLIVAPDQLAGGSPEPSQGYWIINNYGANDSFDELDKIEFTGLSNIEAANISKYKLHKRASNAFGNTWSNEIDYADEGTTSSVVFEGDLSITSFSQFAMNKADVVLPIELSYFTAEKVERVKADLRWETLSEKNVSHFEIERSSDGVYFELLTKVEALGNESTSTVYHVRDEKPLMPVTYYRIKSVDFDGVVGYTPIRYVDFGKEGARVLIYPNPLTTTRILYIDRLEEGKARIDFYDESGKYVMHKKLAGTENAVDLKSLITGVYFYRYTSDTYMTHGKLVVE